jgi:ABC-type transport system involved in multi-copper enzyme maturation permease subunit
MQQLFAIIEETYREARAKKTIVGFFILSSILLLIAFFVFQSSTLQESLRTIEQNKMHGRGGPMASVAQVMVMDIVYMAISSIVFFITLCVGVFATTGFITSQLEKGMIDLLISKPVPRYKYLLGRYSASVSIVLLEAAYFITGLWLIMSLSVGIWNNAFLLSIIYITLGFAGVYAVIVLVSILSRSSALSIIAGLGLYFVSWLISIGHTVQRLTGSEEKGTAAIIADIFYYLFPQASDMSDNMTNSILGHEISVLPIVLVIVSSAAYLGIATFAFSKKEY